MKGLYIYQDKISSPEKKFKNFKFDWKGKTVLELGCNVGKLGLLVLEKGAKEYKGIDHEKNVIAEGVKRYKLDLVADSVNNIKGFNHDVVVAMALFHHFPDEQLYELLFRIDSKELIFEVPCGKNDVGLYQTRTKRWYKKTIQKFYGKVLCIVDSGATNDPHNTRLIFHCKQHEPTSLSKA